MANKEEIKKQAINEEELENVAGGGCWFGAKDVAPDGHDVGCTFAFSWYESMDEYNFKHDICPLCAGKLGPTKYVGTQKYKICEGCGRGIENKWE